MANAATPTTPFLTLDYDVEGRLFKSTNNGLVLKLRYDGTKLISEYFGSGTFYRHYVHGPGVDEPVVWFDNEQFTTPRYYVQNYQGSVIAFTGPTGNMGELYKYGPYGEPKNVSNADSWTGSRFRYTGQVRLDSGELYYYKARVYDPKHGRFLQTDPIGSKDDLDLYAYTGGDPINKSDPSGLAGCDKSLTKTECSQWKENQDQAKKDVANIRTAEAAFRQDPNSALGKQFATAMTNTYGKDALGSENMARLDGTLNSLTNFYNDPGTAKGGKFDVAVANISGLGYGGTIRNGKATFGHDYFTSKNSEWVRRTTIHEPLHLMGYGDRYFDGKGFKVTSPYWDMEYAKINPKGAKKNADNTACLISGGCN